MRSVLSVIFVLHNWPLDVSSHYPALGPRVSICHWYAAARPGRRSHYERSWTVGVNIMQEIDRTRLK